MIKDKLYNFNTFKNKKDNNQYQSKYQLQQFNLIIPDKLSVASLQKIQKITDISIAISEGIKLTKDLANMPANICTPNYLANQAKKLSKDYKNITCKVLEKSDMQKLKMGALLSVAQGSPQPPKLVILNYKSNRNNQKPIVLVGKGITFDTGGNSLKPAANMIGMKYDMCGAATVLGLLKFAAMSKLNLNIIGIIAAAENTPGGHASRPDDIVTSMAGITIEILNTDAEGRLVLCDALTYCERFKPQAVIDIATLTGACVVALGRYHSGLYGNSNQLIQELLKASDYSYDKCWHMPLTDEYHEQLTSNFADIANVGGSEAGSITAACFLSKFTEKYPWAHLDVAGTACCFSGKEKSASGQPVGLLAQYLINQVSR